MNYLRIDELNERLDELISLRDAKGEAEVALENARTAREHATEEETEAAQEALDDAERDHEAASLAFGEEEAQELAELEALRDEVGAEGDHISEDGGPFIDEGDWEDYARQLAEDICPSSAVRNAMSQWPYRHIDWDAAATELKQDYNTVTFRGTDYLYRA